MRIALLGSAPSSINQAPFRDKSYSAYLDGKPEPAYPPSPFIDQDWSLWGCSPGCFAVAPKFSRFFEVHRWEPGQPWFSPEYVQFLREFRGPVYTGGHVEELAHNQIIYPLQQVEAEFSAFFLTSSLSLMAAIAILEIQAIRRARFSRETLPPLVSEEELDKDDSEDVIAFWGVDMCVSPDTKVLTSDLRWVRADAVSVGDDLIGFDEEQTPGVGSRHGKRRWRTAKVLKANTIQRPCYRVYMEDGTQLVCSAEHRWLTRAEHNFRWRRTDELVTRFHRKDRPSRIIKLCDVWAEDRSWEAGYLAAAFDGEGHISQRVNDGAYASLLVGFSQRDNAMSSTVMSAMKARGYDFTVASRNGKNKDCVNYAIRGGRAKTMKFLGSIRPRRLLAKFDPDRLGIMHKLEAVAVTKIEPIGDLSVIGLRTSTGTFVAEGFASHNSASEEYSRQKPGCWFFMFEILRRGIGLYYPPESDLGCPEPVYGISEWDHAYIKATTKMKEINSRSGQLQQDYARIQAQMQADAGAREMLQYQIKNWIAERHKLPAGVILRQNPDSGLGVGTT